MDELESVVIDSRHYTSLHGLGKSGRQGHVILKMMENHSIYLHIPFCQQRCGYCDFNTYAGISDLIEPYVEALIREIQFCGEGVGAGEKVPVHTVYYGGGTPSLLEPRLIADLTEAIKEYFELLPKSELTLEANPGTVDQKKLTGYYAAGINRLSLGVQSANQKELRLLDRLHGYPEAVEAVEIAREVGFGNISFDLIYGLPGQRLEDWEKTVDLALELDPEHLSLYALTVEEGTPLHLQVEQGFVVEPEPDVAADIYEWTIETLEDLGWVQYEISNWARRDVLGDVLVSRHNLQYWLNRPYFGFGAGAHGYVSGYRIENEPFPAKYIAMMEAATDVQFPMTPVTVTQVKIDQFTEMQETMMMGLRLVRYGVFKDRFQTRFGEDFTDVFAEEIIELGEKGLVEWVGEERESLRLTRKARLLGNQVFRYFV
jgi:oxygen-independent coproporphyrinogen-3 oxidase